MLVLDRIRQRIKNARAERAQENGGINRVSLTGNQIVLEGKHAVPQRHIELPRDVRTICGASGVLKFGCIGVPLAADWVTHCSEVILQALDIVDHSRAQSTWHFAEQNPLPVKLAALRDEGFGFLGHADDQFLIGLPLVALTPRRRRARRLKLLRIAPLVNLALIDLPHDLARQ